MFGDTEMLFSLWLKRASKESLELAVQKAEPTRTRSIDLGLSPADGATVAVMSWFVASTPR